MNDAHFEKLKRQAKETRDRKIAKARDEYQLSLTSIENVRRLEKELSSKGDPQGNGQRRVARGALSAAIKAAVSTIQGEFSSETVMRAIAERNPEAASHHRASVASALRRLVENGTVDTVVEPKGRRAGVYRMSMTDVDAEEGPPATTGGPNTSSSEEDGGPL